MFIICLLYIENQFLVLKVLEISLKKNLTKTKFLEKT